MAKPVLVGAVVYEPKVVIIWNIIRDYFEERGVPMDCVFYNNYELQVEQHLAGAFDIAWHSPLAWVDAQRQSAGACRAIAMRDTDRDRKTHILVRKGSGINSLQDLRGKTLATGAKDSPQATLIPIGQLQRNGLEPGQDFQVRRFDVLVGKHGDHIGGELDALKSLQSGESDASAALDLNWERWSADGTADPEQIEVLATTDQFDHCVFAVRPDFPKETEERWLEALYSMDYNNPAHREMMDMEGLREWLPGRTSGFGPLSEAVERQGFFGER
jgi:phosphonate transport system substrate-binding protein